MPEAFNQRQAARGGLVGGPTQRTHRLFLLEYSWERTKLFLFCFSFFSFLELLLQLKCAIHSHEKKKKFFLTQPFSKICWTPSNRPNFAGSFLFSAEATSCIFFFQICCAKAHPALKHEADSSRCISWETSTLSYQCLLIWWLLWNIGKPWTWTEI